MRRRDRTITMGLAGAVLLSSGMAQAQDASFGWKVLMCAAATAPGWSGIPYCIPVREQLFSDIRRGGGWPACMDATGGLTAAGTNQNCPNATAGDRGPCANTPGE